MASEVEEIKLRLDIVDVINDYVRLQQLGTNWRARCPFHNEKTPSFMASREKQIWHCFGCGKGGDIFSFVQEIEGIEFPEALRLLAQKAGVTITAQNPQLNSQKNRLMDICVAATAYWQKVLAESPQAYRARTYLEKRKVTASTIADFKIGYALDAWDPLIKYLAEQKFSVKEIFLAGLAVEKQRGAGFYDRFRNRIIFPINDLHGNPVGFSGRTLDADPTTAKYINTPQTLIYNKSTVVFNLDKAKLGIKSKDGAIVVEGQMDVIAAYQVDTPNVVAASGTAFTLEQLRTLKRYTNNLAIAFDTDVAGESASRRGIDLALGNEMNVNIISLPQGKDPDECISANPQDWFNAIAKSQSIMEYYFQQAGSRFDVTDVKAKKEVAKILLGIIVQLGNKIEQSHWLQKLSDLISVPEAVLREALPARQSTTPGTRSSPPAITPVNPAPAPRTRGTLLAERLVALCLKYPTLIPAAFAGLEPAALPAGTLRDLYKQLHIYYTQDIGEVIENFVYQEFRQKISHQGLDRQADSLFLLAEKDFFDFTADQLGPELSTITHALAREDVTNQLKDLEYKIKKAEQAGQMDVANSLSEQSSLLLLKLNRFN